MMLEASKVDMARAARLAAAVSADDLDGSVAVFNEVGVNVAELRSLAIALAVRHVQVAGEFYDTDCQQILDMFAMDAMTFAENAGGDVP